MKEKGKRSLFWHYVSEDRDLVFFTIGFVIWLVDFLADLGGIKSGSRFWLLARLAIPAFFALGIIFYLRKHLGLTQQLTTSKHLPVLFVVGKPWDEARQALDTTQQAITRLTGFKSFHQMEEAFNVRLDYLVAHEKGRLAPDLQVWKDFIEDAEQNIQRFCDAVPGEKTYHIFIYGPASLALGLGAAFGSKRRLVVYQLVDEQYEAVLKLTQDVRRIKKTLPETQYKYINVSYPSSFTPDLGMVLDMASHTALGDARAYVKRQPQNMELVEVKNTYDGNLTEADWTPVVQELYSVFHFLQSKEQVDRLHLFHSMPVALAFGLGVALGNFVPVTVYNWEASEATYYPVLKLNQLDSFL